MGSPPNASLCCFADRPRLADRRATGTTSGRPLSVTMVTDAKEQGLAGPPVAGDETATLLGLSGAPAGDVRMEGRWAGHERPGGEGRNVVDHGGRAGQAPRVRRGNSSSPPCCTDETRPHRGA